MTQVKKETTKEVKQEVTEPIDVTAKPVTTVDVNEHEDVEKTPEYVEETEGVEEETEKEYSGLNPTEIAEIQNGLGKVKDLCSDRMVYETASASMAALKANGKL